LTHEKTEYPRFLGEETMTGWIRGPERGVKETSGYQSHNVRGKSTGGVRGLEQTYRDENRTSNFHRKEKKGSGSIKE